VPRDNTKYRFNNDTYGKGRLVHAIVSQSIQKNKPTVEQLRQAFPKELQGSFGVFYTEQEYNARKKISNDQTERFFTNTEDRLTTDGEQIFVCTEWGKDNVTKFVKHSKTLGFDIKVDAKLLTDEEIINHFVHKPAFEQNYKNWPAEVLSSFCELMRFANQTGLDIFTVNMNSGGAIRIGRKGHDHQIAREVFAIFEPCKDKINFSQRSQHKDNRQKGELNTDSFERMKASGDLQEFSQEHPISRNPYWPSDYQENSTYANNTQIWKVSHSPTVLDNQQLEWLAENELLAVHKNTGNGSVPCFEHMSEGDIVSLGYGNQVVRLVRVISGIETKPDSPLGDEWLLRSYVTIKGLDKPVKYEGQHKRWSPRFNGTSWEVPINEYLIFEQEILAPYYDLTLEDLGFEISQVSKFEGVKSNMSKQQKAPINQILYGPPGTGKTYQTIESSVNAAEPEFIFKTREQLKEKYDELVAEKRIRFVTFHQSYGYEEFVEGLRANSDEGVISYDVEPGIFRQVCTDASKNLAKSMQLSSKTDFDVCWDEFLNGFDEDGVKVQTKKSSFMVTEITGKTIHFEKAQGTSHHSLAIKTLKEVFEGNRVIKGGLNVYYQPLVEHLKQFSKVDKSVSEPLKNFVLIIDEINRGNISKIFGELITLIEDSKRAHPSNTEALEVVLPNSGDSFSVPSNIYLIGTMNTADRSLAMMDTALRRRFSFLEMMPNPFLFDEIVVEGISLTKLLFTMNRRIEALYDRDHTLGHAFFVPVMQAFETQGEQLAFEELKNAFTNKVIPLLEEYFFDDWNKIRLVLGDNQKPEYLQFVTQDEVPYQELFGDNHGLDTYEQAQKTYSLVSHVEQDSVWHNPAAYQAIYDPENV
jgi:5-methylcytosine-specific restriction protein B